MTRVDTIKAIRAFLEANGLNTNAVSNDGPMTNYIFNISIESINEVLDVVFSVSDQGDLSSSVYVDIDDKNVSKDELYKLVNWLNLENSAFVGCASYIEEDHAIAVIKSVDSYFHKDIYGEEVSYLLKLQVALIEDYFSVIEDVVSGKTLAEAVNYFNDNKEKH